MYIFFLAMRSLYPLELVNMMKMKNPVFNDEEFHWAFLLYITLRPYYSLSLEEH